MQHIILLNQPRLFIRHTLPGSWQVSIRSPEEWDTLVNELNGEISSIQLYICNDLGYDTIARSQLVGSSRGFCTRLSDLVQNKYNARSTLNSIQHDIPYTLCYDNKVSWPYDPEDDLFAKPVSGAAAKGTVKHVRHGTVLPDIGEAYLIEKYIPDKYQRLTVDCYISGNKMGFITSCDNMYHNHLDKVQYHYLGMPSKYHYNPALKARCFEILKELQEVTGCDNQVIDIEFFCVDGKFLVMEINPRVTFNILPIYEDVSGVNPWVFMEHLAKGVVLELPEHQLKTGVSRYSYLYSNEPTYIEHDNDTFSIHLKDYSHTFSTCELTKSHEELIREIDEKYLPGDPAVN